MNLTNLQSLLTLEGQNALAEADSLAPDEATFLRCFNRLSKHYGSALARAALTTALLRRKAIGKFTRAASMYFESEALEQSSHEVVAAHRSLRFCGMGVIADLCCGLGGDAIALANCGEVLAVDRDPLRLQLCELNLSANERSAGLICGNVLEVNLSHTDAVFIDPDRRPEGRRCLSLSECEPPLADVLARLPAAVPACAKVAPGVPWADLSRLDAEAEFVSLGGELKECAVWLGSFRTVRRRATVLPAGATLAADASAPSPGCAIPKRYLYDPDPAVVRAGLVTDLALQLGARQLDAEVAYLSADERPDTPFARVHEITESMPFHLGRLRELLRARRVGRVQVQRRGSAIDPAELTRRLKLKGDEVRTLVLTRVEGVPWVLVCR